MNKTKIRNFALLFTLLLFIASLAFSVVTLFKVKADTEDVNVEIASTSNMVETTDNNIYGKENVKAIGWTGWGGNVTTMTLTET